MPVLVSRARDAGAHGRLAAMRSLFAAETIEDSNRAVATYVAPTVISRQAARGGFGDTHMPIRARNTASPFGSLTTTSIGRS